MSTVPYVTLAEIKDYLSISSNNHDARLSNLIVTGCAVIENYIGTEILANNYSETLDGGKPNLYVSRLPLNYIHQLDEFNGTEYVTLLGPNMDASSVSSDSDNHDLSGTVSFSSRYKKFGKTSANLISTSSISIQNHEDFWIDTQDYTVELYARLPDLSSNQVLYSQSTDANNYLSFNYDKTYGLNFRYVLSDVEIISISGNSNTISSSLRANSWLHLAFTKQSDNINLFINGTQISDTNNAVATDSIIYFQNNPKIGGMDVSPLLNNGSNLVGHIDEFRISNSSRYNASFTVSAYRFNTDSATKCLIHFDDSKLIDVHDTPGEYIFDPLIGSISKSVFFGEGDLDVSVIPTDTFYNAKRAIKVTYNAGYSSAPNDLKLATMDYIKMLYKQTQENNTNILSGEHANKYPLSANFPPHIRRILDLYRIIM